MSKLSGLYEGNDKNPNYDIGHFFICIDPENFADLDDFKKNVGDVMREIKSSKCKRGDEILVPGETEYNTSIEVHKNGIEISDVLLEELNSLGFNKWQKQHTTNNSK
jgi:LDH2 family malate/lactate/ureidoglycolate dehydrogenase